MNITVNPELQAYIDPLTPDEHDALERSMLVEGCRDALVLWGETLVDGHNRYGICQKHDLPYQTVQNPRFQSIEDVHLWMIDQHLGRRSISDFQRGELALRKRAIVSGRRARAQVAALSDVTAAAQALSSSEASAATTDSVAPSKPLDTREDIARAARLSSNQVVLIEKIRNQAAPELVAAVKSGTISINAAAAVASLPQEEQKAAVMAGKEELQLAAKRVRDARRKPHDEASDQGQDVASAQEAELQALRLQVAQLQAENATLRQQLDALRDSAGAGNGIDGA